MPKVRQKSADQHHRIFADETQHWTAGNKTAGSKHPQSFRSYLEKHGVAHLLMLGRIDDAEHRMCNLDFMAAYIDSWDIFVEPWTAWRIIGTEKAKLGQALSSAFTTKDLTPADGVLQDLIDLLGEDHARVQKARERIAAIQEQLKSRVTEDKG